MDRSRVRALVGSVALAALVATSFARDAAGEPPAAPRKSLAQSLPPDARRDYDVAKLLFEDGDYATALIKYQAAYEATHDARLLWNFAVCEKNLRHYATATALLARYQAEGGDLLTAADRRDARDFAKAIAPFVASVTLHVSEDGADGSVDDRPVGTSPLPGPLSLDIGLRRVRVHKDGYRVVDKSFPVGGSASPNLDVKLEAQGGHLALVVPADADVTVDDRAAGRGPRVELDLSAGPHGLHVTAPHMRPYHGDVVVEDGKARTVEVDLEREAAPWSEVRVAVACIGPEPAPQERLAVFLDHASESTLPLGVRMRRGAGGDAVAYVAYRVAPGQHAVRVESAGCEARETTIDVAEGAVAEVTGELPPVRGFFDVGPAGTQDGYRLSVGPLVGFSSFSAYPNLFSPNSKPPSSDTGAGALAGLSAVAGLQGRWLTLLGDARAQVGNVGDGGTYDSTIVRWTLGVRPGVRLPLYVAALSAGVGVHFGQYFFTPAHAGTGQSGFLATGSVWAALDAQLWCEFGSQLGAETSADGYNAGAGASSATLWLHFTYTPNEVCTKTRDGSYRIQGTGR